jgi:hypothetical protein
MKKKKKKRLLYMCFSWSSQPGTLEQNKTKSNDRAAAGTVAMPSNLVFTLPCFARDFVQRVFFSPFFHANEAVGYVGL